MRKLESWRRDSWLPGLGMGLAEVVPGGRLCRAGVVPSLERGDGYRALREG